MVIESRTKCYLGPYHQVCIFAAEWLMISNFIGELGCFTTRLK